MWSCWWFKLSSPETQREKETCNHQELLLRQVHLRIEGFSFLYAREVFSAAWVRSKFRLHSSDTGSSRLSSIGSEGKAVTVQDFHFKNNATVCLPTEGRGGRLSRSRMLKDLLCLSPFVFYDNFTTQSLPAAELTQIRARSLCFYSSPL